MSARKRTGKHVRSTKAVLAASGPTTRPPSLEDENAAVDMKYHVKGQPVWVVLAIASGACAAINGVFAKLTTTSLTSGLASRLSVLFGVSPDNSTINIGLRGTFFGLNLLFNAIMWTLFTKALTHGDSTTRVSIVNVSTNFFVTAMLGWAIFGEQLPVQWWMGAGLLAAGNVVIGRRKEDDKPVADSEESVELTQHGEDDLIDLDDPANSHGRRSLDEANRLKHGEEIDAPV